LHGGLHRGQARLPARQLGWERITTTAPQRRVFRFVLLMCRRAQPC